jgi:hypothetical protein
MRPFLRFIIVALVLVAQAATMGAARDVVCVGRDGHVAIESPADKAACAERLRSVVSIIQTDGVNVLGGDASVCVDTPIPPSAQAATATTVKQTQQSLLPQPIDLVSRIIAMPAPFVGRFSSRSAESPPLHLALADLRTIVLLV